MRSIIQPVLTFVRWVICHTDSGRKFTRFYKETCDKRRRHKACMRLQRYGWEILERTDAALKNWDTGYFVDYGTLLGLVREKGFIRHDDDIDFSLPYGKLSPKDLLELMLKNGFTFMRSFVWQERVTEITFLYKKIEVDFFYMFHDEDGCWFSLAYDTFVIENGVHVAKEVRRFDKPNHLDVVKRLIHGVNVAMPCAEAEVLEYTYGSTWMTPINNFKPGNDAKYDDLDHQRRIEGVARMFVTLDKFMEYLSGQS